MAGPVGRFVATFLRVLLMPVIVFGIPAWPILGIFCAVPIVGIFAIPLFILLTLLLLYSIAWFSYLVLAQADPPASSQNGALSHYLPFLPYSPMRCLKINWAALMYATSALKVALPAVLDWSYRRVMVLGTQGGGGIVKENISYGSERANKRLDVYLPPSSTGAAAAAAAAASNLHSRNASSTPATTTDSDLNSVRHRKHSTHFADWARVPQAQTYAQADAEDDADATPRPDGGGGNARPVVRAPVIVIVPSPIPPLTWTHRRKTYLQLALRLRRMGYCVIVPDIAWYPETRVNGSIVDLRLVLRWVADNCKRYGGDERRIYLLSHGMSAHLAMLTLTQEAVVLSREGFLHRQSSAQAKREELVNWDSRDADETILAASSTAHQHVSENGSRHSSSGSSNHEVKSPTDENAWVDEGAEDDLPPGAVMNGEATLDAISARRARGLGELNRVSPTMTGKVAFPSTQLHSNGARHNDASPAEQHQHSLNSSSNGNGHSYDTSAHGASAVSTNGTLDVSSISNGLRRVEIYRPEIAVPPIAGVILLSGVFDVIKCFRNESDRGVEHLSVLRRSCGPSHTSCLLHSPAHLLYAAKNILDTSLLPPKFLLVHGGKDAVVDISQSTLLKTLLSGIGVENVKLRAYRELGHVEAIASLFLGMGKASTRYSKQILHDIGDFIAD